jgi:hypothetical protein
VQLNYNGDSMRSEFVYDYDAFGKETRSSTLVAGLNPDSFPFHYSTKFTDPESGFNYYGYRFCAPSKAWHLCAIKQHNPAGWETRRYLNHETGKQLKRNCVTARWGGEHREENPIDRNASEHDSASNVDEPASEGRSPRSVSASSAGQRDGRSLAWWTIRRAGCGWWQ